jgi:hypothetical protein
LEGLEDRIVPAIAADGTILVPNYGSNEQGIQVPVGIIGVDPTTGAQQVLSTNGSQGNNFVFPLCVVQPSTITNSLSVPPFYVMDQGVGGTGGIIEVDGKTGNQTLSPIPKCLSL